MYQIIIETAVGKGLEFVTAKGGGSAGFETVHAAWAFCLLWCDSGRRAWVVDAQMLNSMDEEAK